MQVVQKVGQERGPRKVVQDAEEVPGENILGLPPIVIKMKELRVKLRLEQLSLSLPIANEWLGEAPVATAVGAARPASTLPNCVA